eukprot:580119-Hanusia_phi.AAC.5
MASVKLHSYQDKDDAEEQRGGGSQSGRGRDGTGGGGKRTPSWFPSLTGGTGGDQFGVGVRLVVRRGGQEVQVI